MNDFYGMGYNAGRGYHWKNRNREFPRTDGDRYSYERGLEHGERMRRVSDELDRELYGE
jgi:hypothetical protein